MRKTLTAVVVLLAAGSLAACDKMPWAKKAPEPAPVATVTETPTTPDPTVVAEPPKTADQTAATDPAKTVTPATPPTPAAK